MSFHFWVPDVTRGTGGTAATFLTTVPKVGALVAVYRLVATVSGGNDSWLVVATVLATASMFVGNLAAYW